MTPPSGVESFLSDSSSSKGSGGEKPSQEVDFDPSCQSPGHLCTRPVVISNTPFTSLWKSSPNQWRSYSTGKIKIAASRHDWVLCLRCEILHVNQIVFAGTFITWANTGHLLGITILEKDGGFLARKVSIPQLWKLRIKELRFFSHLKHLPFARSSHRLLCISDGARIFKWCLQAFLSALGIGKVIQMSFLCVSVSRSLGSQPFAVEEWECNQAHAGRGLLVSSSHLIWT